MIWNYVVVTERVNKIGKTETRESIYIEEEQVKENISNFIKNEVDNLDAIKGTHYNFGIFYRNKDLENKMFPRPRNRRNL